MTGRHVRVRTAGIPADAPHPQDRADHDPAALRRFIARCATCPWMIEGGHEPAIVRLAELHASTPGHVVRRGVSR